MSLLIFLFAKIREIHQIITNITKIKSIQQPNLLNGKKGQKEGLSPPFALLRTAMFGLQLSHQSHTPHKFLSIREPHHIEICSIW
jgi:hypothetical protein